MSKGAMRQQTTRGTIVAGVATYLLLFAMGSWRAQHEDAARHRARAEAARLEDTAGHAEVRNEWASLRAASGATGELPAFYEQQWVPLIGVLAAPPKKRVRRPSELHDALAEYARGAPNFCRAPGSSSDTLGSCLRLLDFSKLEVGEREYEALIESFSPAARATAEGLAAERVAAWEKELARGGDEENRDEAEYAVFIEKHLRRQYRGRTTD